MYISLTFDQAHQALVGHEPVLVLRGRLQNRECECGEKHRNYPDHLVDVLINATEEEKSDD